jgi:hypothetical protein
VTENELDQIRNDILHVLISLRDQTGETIWLDKRFLASKLVNHPKLTDVITSVGSLTQLDYVQIDRDLKPNDGLADFSNIRLTNAGMNFFDHGNRFVGSATHDNAPQYTLPEGFVFSEIIRIRLVSELEKAEIQIESAVLDNEIKSQARGYLVAARILAEMPEPPTSMIWELVSRANALAGIASLIVSVIALFLMK